MSSILGMLILNLKYGPWLEFFYCFYVLIYKDVFGINVFFCKLSGCKIMEADSYFIKPGTEKNQWISKSKTCQRSSGIGPNGVGPSLKGSFWSSLTPV